MKELSIEEKAYDGNYKAYTELINRLEDIKNAIKKQNYGIAMDILCKPYPEFQITTYTELKESEDERIRKEMITYLSTVEDKELIPYESWIAWLEKQGEHANFRNKIQVGDKVTRNEDGILVNLSQLNRVAKKDEKQGEQNPVNAFKVGAKWQKEHLWKSADGDDLPEIDREVIALLDNGKVVFAHRPPEYWDGKNIVTGKVTRNYPKTYDKGGWNIPNVKYWLDCSMSKEIEL